MQSHNISDQNFGSAGQNTWSHIVFSLFTFMIAFIPSIVKVTMYSHLFRSMDFHDFRRSLLVSTLNFSIT